MSNDSGPVMPLEQRCVKPGHWVIEGYDVHRTNTGWNIYFTVSSALGKPPCRRYGTGSATRGNRETIEILNMRQFWGTHPEHVSIEALMTHREYEHGPGYSRGINGERYGAKRRPSAPRSNGAGRARLQAAQPAKPDQG